MFYTRFPKIWQCFCVFQCFTSVMPINVNVICHGSYTTLILTHWKTFLHSHNQQPNILLITNYVIINSLYVNCQLINQMFFKKRLIFFLNLFYFFVPDCLFVLWFFFLLIICCFVRKNERIWCEKIDVQFIYIMHITLYIMYKLI